MKMIPEFKVLRILSPWWKSEEKKTAWFALILLAVLIIASVFLDYLFNNWIRHFYDALENKDSAKFIHQTKLFVPLLFAVVIIFCLKNFLSNLFAFKWRKWCLENITGKWINNKKAYYLSALDPDTSSDNPDQRISVDIDNMCSLSFVMFTSLLKESLVFVTFSIVLWNISESISLKFFGYTIAIKGMLLYAAILYGVLWTLITFKIGNRLIKLDVIQEKLEANLRFKLMRIIERREEIANLSGEKLERNGLIKAFLEITHNYYQILYRNAYLNITQNLSSNLDQFIPLFIAGPSYFAGAFSFGVLVQIMRTFNSISNSLSILINSFSEIAALLASIKRIDKFQQDIAKSESIKPVLQRNNEKLLINNLSIFTPQNDLIIKIPYFELFKGEKKIIMGNSGAGKSSLIRVISEIYPYYEGIVELPKEEIFIIPQRPYMPIATLRECLSYPSLPFEDKEIKHCLSIAHLANLVDYLDVSADWQNRLSLGEQQRVNFVRILLHKPKWLIMDEPTSSLNEDLRKRLIETLISTLPATSILMVSHNLDCKEYFNEVVQLG